MPGTDRQKMGRRPGIYTPGMDPEVDLKLRGVHVPALDLGFPKQQGKKAYAEKYNYYLKEDRRASFHS